MGSLSSFVDPWKQSLDQAHQPHEANEFPELKRDALITTSQPISFQVGTGASIYTNTLLPAILNEARHEIILVTCFWAQSSTLAALKETLEQLAKQRLDAILAEGPDSPVQPLRIRICFSSRSLLQNLLHTSSKDGYVYPTSAFTAKLGLPSRETLEAGAIDLQVKSLFFMPFSVMHPKFLIIDRKKAWLPSCNISWESWLEGCVEFTGEAIDSLMRFYRSVWDKQLGEMTHDHLSDHLTEAVMHSPGLVPVGLASVQSPAGRFIPLTGLPATLTVLLPSSHHRNPQFRPLPWTKGPVAPPTPLNIALLRLFEMAERSLYIQTPNLTAAPAMDAILEAIRRGVNVTIVTSKGMMLLEQILTSGTTTNICLRSFLQRYKSLLHAHEHVRLNSARSNDAVIDVEAQLPRPGKLKVSYFHANAEESPKEGIEEPVHSHLKLTIVDGQYTVLGSGNMDRASWFTSQELGILFQSADFAQIVTKTVSEVLEDGRLETIFDSEEE